MKLQQYFFSSALAELGISANAIMDHKHGYNIINEVCYNIKYPKEYVNNINSLSKEKLHDYCFIGFVGNNGRTELLEPFTTPTSIVKNSSSGRKSNSKFNFDLDYYQTIASSKYSLCPIHVGDWYLHDRAWTYRYIESLFCKSIPIVFQETPLGDKFTKDTFFLWSDQSHDITQEEYHTRVEDNYNKALEYWTITDSEHKQILSTTALTQ